MERVHCMLILNGVVKPSDVIPISSAIATTKPYAMDWSPDTIRVAARLESEKLWEFEAIPNGNIPQILLDALTPSGLSWAWVRGEFDYKDTQILFYNPTLDAQFPYHDEAVALTATNLTPDRITAAQHWQHWLENRTLILAESAHDYFKHRSKTPT